jgi:hypothetical protein
VRIGGRRGSILLEDVAGVASDVQTTTSERPDDELPTAELLLLDAEVPIDPLDVVHSPDESTELR